MIDGRQRVTQAAHASTGALRTRDIDSDALKVVRRLIQAGHDAFLVGGCVRDLYLGIKPKDFDVATSATPEQIRKIFRNSRIIGRRFRLVHVFFGSKVIETSTFRAAPPEQVEGEDLMIRRDNEWGSIEEDARRRDFTVNGLFYDIQVGEIVDFVDGLHDLDARLIRSIGDPVVRFAEDPVRMIRAVKFAARLDFEIEDSAWAALLEVAPDLAKCSRARLLEEMYKLLRSGAAKRSFELMLETGIFDAVWEEYLSLYKRDGGLGRDLGAHNTTVAAPSELAGAVTALDDGSSPKNGKDESKQRRNDSVALFWRYLGALDDYVQAVGHAPANGVLQAVLFAPLLADEIQNAPRGGLDHKLEELMVNPCAALGVARRDRELARQIMMAHRRMVAPGRRGAKVSMAQRQYFHDALVFLGLSVEARDDDGGALAHWQRLASSVKDEPEPAQNRRRKRRRRSGRGRKRSGGGKSASANDS